MDMQTSPAASMTAPFAERYDNFIGGQWVAPKDGRYFDNVSSITGKPVGKVARTSQKTKGEYAGQGLALSVEHPRGQTLITAITSNILRIILR